MFRSESRLMLFSPRDDGCPQQVETRKQGGWRGSMQMENTTTLELGQLEGGELAVVGRRGVWWSEMREGREGCNEFKATSNFHKLRPENLEQISELPATNHNAASAWVLDPMAQCMSEARTNWAE